MQSRASVIERRKIGSYYSPRNVTDALSAWAIRSKQERILEPGFGGCEFLESAAQQLRLLGAKRPATQLFGCDIDPAAFEYLHSRLGLTQIRGHFLLRDFLALGASDFASDGFDVVLGNPPYVRHHNTTPAQKISIRTIRNYALPELSLQASLWAFFVVHACSFLKEGGRAAWILPSSVVQANYAQALRRYIGSHFESSLILTLDERLFHGEGAVEGTAVLVADGWRGAANSVADQPGLANVRNVAQLRTLLSRGVQKPRSRPSSASTTMAEIAPRSELLGEFCKLSIGVVTGDAGYFLFGRNRATRFRIQKRTLRPIVSKAKMLRGLSISHDDLEQAFENDIPCMILDTTGRRGRALERYLARKTPDEIEANLTFGKRPVWHQPLDSVRTDGFFSGMSHFGPKLVLNKAHGTTCTNTLYRIAFRTRLKAHEKRAVCLGLVGTYGQLSAEMKGRSYGAGMLKHEPSDAASIRLLIPRASKRRIEKTFSIVDQQLRAGDESGARKTVDNFLVCLGQMTANECRVLDAALERKRRKRWQSKARV